MDDGWKTWPAKFSSKCGNCGAPMSEGEIVYGTTNPILVRKGKFFVVCGGCASAESVDDMIAATGDKIKGLIELMTVITPPVPPKVMTRPTSKSDTDELDDLFASGELGGEPPGSTPEPITYMWSTPATTLGAPAPEVPPSSTPIVAGIPWDERSFRPPTPAAPTAVEPWSLKWIELNATWSLQ